MELFYLGRINGTHHLKGTVKVYSFFEDVEKIINNKIIAEKSNGEKKILTINNIEIGGDKLLYVDFEEIKNKTEALNIMNAKLYIRRDILGTIEDGNIYQSDYIGLNVYDKEDNLLGTIEDIMETAAHDIFIILDENNEEIMIPNVEVFIKKIDFYNNKLIVDIPESLKNINKSEEK
ncbi:16S rRNA processing protein RimM [Hypnocyclicus thermotrophus]|uniref:Ribosome maturation factor RimM n=1 Tax=Hypnocyclicus thermotrophus TaxID=1627895 RepID=A0AA46DXK4_9FUSO|nr:ribosome maturation factor RimM [Hypnocyclicus thermotrophus]TDT68540.1 16S rRNA processing protein RimM [Hypnocyclicus thermotrophus]